MRHTDQQQGADSKRPMREGVWAEAREHAAAARAHGAAGAEASPGKAGHGSKPARGKAREGQSAAARPARGKALQQRPKPGSQGAIGPAQSKYPPSMIRFL